MSTTNEVELAGITKRFNGVAAVDSISLAVHSGEFLTLLGPSGCGKTTLLRLIGGFVSPDSGRVLLGGKDVTDLPPYRRNVSTVFQQYALFPHMTVFDNVAFGLERRRVGREDIRARVKQALDLVKLAGMDSRRPAELSGGQQQRVALARSLVIEPRVLLLDEPLAALDLKLRKQMQIELKGLQRRVGISFVYVTHDQEEALTMSDRIVVMNSGKIEQEGASREIYERPVNEFVADFIGVSNIIEGTVISLTGTTVTLAIAGSRFDARVDDGTVSIRAGDKARVMVRPEKITLRARTDGEDGLPGKVESATYLGERTKLGVRVTDDCLVLVLEQNRDSADNPADRLGQDVFLSWDAANTVIVRT
ncbi:MAG TPA: ABC transporter ATP-binding protein [Blastocatellia bacterium]|nr:ABC transporter ATP-binding protein [Blastocatellia bacterium]